MAYADLNPIRALLAMKPEDSTFTSIADRIRDIEEKLRLAAAAFQQPDAADSTPVVRSLSASGPEPDAGLSGSPPIASELASTSVADPGRVSSISDRRSQTAVDLRLSDVVGLTSSSGDTPVGDAGRGADGESRQSIQADEARAHEGNGTPAATRPLAILLSRAAMAAYTVPNYGRLNPIDERGDGYAGVAARRRASDLGTLPISLETYVQIVDWTGRPLRTDKRGAIPNDLRRFWNVSVCERSRGWKR